MIEQARAILDKWRKSAGPSAWDVFEMWGPDDQFVRISNGTDHVTDSHRDFMGLIAGLAGNPDLWDALDALLALSIEYGDLPPGKGSRFIERANHLAAAIVSADEKMSA